MKAIKDFYVITTLIVLMIIRPFAPGEWFGSIVIAGLLVTWLDTTYNIWKSNTNITSEREKARYAIVLIIMALLGAAMLILIILNLIMEITWLNTSIVLDEATLLALLLCLSQNTIIGIANCIIKSKH